MSCSWIFYGNYILFTSNQSKIASLTEWLWTPLAILINFEFFGRSPVRLNRHELFMKNVGSQVMHLAFSPKSFEGAFLPTIFFICSSLKTGTPELQHMATNLMEIILEKDYRWVPKPSEDVLCFSLVCSFLQALIILLFDGGDPTDDLSTRNLPEIDRIHYILEIMCLLFTRVTSSMMEALSASVLQTDTRLFSLCQRAIAQYSPIKQSSGRNKIFKLFATHLIDPF